MDVDKTASQDDIKKSYRKLARKFHPDVSKEKDAESRFKDINEAYEVLRDKEKRAAYDQLAVTGKVDNQVLHHHQIGKSNFIKVVAASTVPGKVTLVTFLNPYSVAALVETNIQQALTIPVVDRRKDKIAKQRS